MTGRMCSWKACALALVLTLAASSHVWPEPQPFEVDRELADAKSLYASAEFAQATLRLQGVIGRLEQPPRTHAKDLQLAVAGEAQMLTVPMTNRTCNPPFETIFLKGCATSQDNPSSFSCVLTLPATYRFVP